MPGKIAWVVSFTGSRAHIVHPELEDSLLYWHDQYLTAIEGEARLVVGWRPQLGLELAIPVRLVRDRIRFEDASRQLFTPPSPDTHHRNETLTGFGDPRLGVQWARAGKPWTLAISLGATLPFGRTEENPFQLGRDGERHQHLQFGTGTVDPYASASGSRRLGKHSLALSAYAKASLVENEKGYRSGNRASVSASLDRPMGDAWSARVGLDGTHESAERWSGVVEEEGNLGRTDLYLMLGIARRLSSLGTLGVSLRSSLMSDTEGTQAELPLVFQLSLAR